MNYNSLKKEWHKASSEAANIAWDRFIKNDFIPKIKSLFNMSIDHFYNDYEPRVYRREGNISKHTGGLYDILEISASQEGLDINFNETKLPYRNGLGGRGDGLYNLVFIEGWHGGAYSGDYTVLPDRTIYTPHPQTGTPYWRTPTPQYTSWGAPAARAGISPFDEFSGNIMDYWNSDANNIIQRYYNESFDKCIQKYIK